MALSLECASRMSEVGEHNHSSIATFMSLPSPGRSVPEAADAFLFKRTGCRLARTSSVSTSCPDSPTHSFSDELSSTDAGDDDVSPVFADLASSDSEQGDDFTLQTCVYSVMMLLRMRPLLCEDGVPCEVQYGARNISELEASVEKDPPVQHKPKRSPKARNSPTSRGAGGDSADSWRRPAEKLPDATLDSWVAQMRKCTPDDDAKVVRAARSILNKLTIEKFDSLFEQLTNCGILEPHHISILMQEIFEKATIQHHFIPMYADLCVRLENDDRIKAVVKEAGDQHNFRRLLLNQCQMVFEQVLEPSSNDPDKSEMDEEMVFRRKQRALGNMKLIGQLLKHGMLSSGLFPQCCEELLRNRTQCPEALEALVALMFVAGPTFDNKSLSLYGRFEKILADMQALTKDKSTPPRLRFLIRDVLDARVAGWSTRSHTSQGPTKLDEVDNSGKSEKAIQGRKHGLEKLAETCKARSAAKQAPQETVVQAYTTPVTVAQADVAPVPAKSFDIVTFRRTLAAVFTDLAAEKNISAAVQSIRAAEVPAEFQADQFVDIVTRAVEEKRGAIRRCQLAFAASLVNAEKSPFERSACLAGIKLFFADVYNELCGEVHRLPAIMKSEFMPTMLNVYSAADLNAVVPIMMQS